MSEDIPTYEVLDGELRSDGWTTRRLALRFLKTNGERSLRISVRNPGFNEAYLRNTVSLALDGQEVFRDMLFAGQSVVVEQTLPARMDALLELETEAYMVSDALDQRERGVLLKLTQISR